jgi:uncharacterized protein (DUF1697 family)
MISYVALLRGVNLTGKNTVKMADLKAIADAIGLGSARTYIASGNLLFLSNDREAQLRSALEERLRKELGYDVRVMLRTGEELTRILDANPFAEAPGHSVQTFFLNEPPPANLFATIRNQADDERIAIGRREIFVAYGERGIGRSRLRIPAAENGTARNMNTVAKLAELAREMS